MPKILIIRFSSIGDIVLTSPVIRWFDEQVRDTEVHFLVKSRYVELVAYNPRIQKVHTYSDNLSDTMRRLKDERFDLVIDLQNNIRSGKVRRELGAESKVYRKYSFQKWLYSTFKIDRLPRTHVVEKFQLALSDLGIHEDDGGLEFYPEPGSERVLDKISLPEKYIAIAIGAAHEGKRAPLEKHLELIPLLPLPAILVGGSEDWDVAEALVEKTGCLSVVGQTTISESAHIIGRSVLLITNDTGMMHIGAAYQLPIVSLWGQTIPEFGMYPYRAGKGSAIIEPVLTRSRKVAKLGNKPVGKDHDMNHLSVKEILSAVQEILTNQK